MCTSSHSPALQPHFHIGNLDPFQPWDDEPQLASGHCSAGLYGHYLRFLLNMATFKICGRHFAGVVDVVNPMNQPRFLWYVALHSFTMWIHLCVWLTSVNHIPLRLGFVLGLPHQFGFLLTSLQRNQILPLAPHSGILPCSMCNHLAIFCMMMWCMMVSNCWMWCVISIHS